MKYAAIVMVLVVLVCAGVGVYAWTNTKAQITITMTAEAASSRESDFAALQRAMDNDALIGTPFADELPGTSADYSFFTYTFRIKNKGLIDFEMVEIQPVPANGDVLSYATLDPSRANAGLTVRAGKESDAWCVIPTSAQNQESHLVTRTFRVTYYVWGKPHTVTVTYR